MYEGHNFLFHNPFAVSPPAYFFLPAGLEREGCTKKCAQWLVNWIKTVEKKSFYYFSFIHTDYAQVYYSWTNTCTSVNYEFEHLLLNLCKLQHRSVRIIMLRAWSRSLRGNRLLICQFRVFFRELRLKATVIRMCRMENWMCYGNSLKPYVFWCLCQRWLIRSKKNVALW